MPAGFTPNPEKHWHDQNTEAETAWKRSYGDPDFVDSYYQQKAQIPPEIKTPLPFETDDNFVLDSEKTPEQLRQSWEHNFRTAMGSAAEHASSMWGGMERAAHGVALDSPQTAKGLEGTEQHYADILKDMADNPTKYHPTAFSGPDAQESLARQRKGLSARAEAKAKGEPDPIAVKMLVKHGDNPDSPVADTMKRWNEWMDKNPTPGGKIRDAVVAAKSAKGIAPTVEVPKVRELPHTPRGLSGKGNVALGALLGLGTGLYNKAFGDTPTSWTDVANQTLQGGLESLNPLGVFDGGSLGTDDVPVEGKGLNNFEPPKPPKPKKSIPDEFVFGKPDPNLMDRMRQGMDIATARANSGPALNSTIGGISDEEAQENEKRAKAQNRKSQDALRPLGEAMWSCITERRKTLLTGQAYRPAVNGSESS
jgi:hypothetical protein